MNEQNCHQESVTGNMTGKDGVQRQSRNRTLLNRIENTLIHKFLFEKKNGITLKDD